MKRSKPQGLGASAKKTVLQQDGTAVNQITGNSLPEEKGFCTLPEDATALDQVKALYDAALMLFLEEGLKNLRICCIFLDKVNREKSLQLFYGVANECLRLEAVREASQLEDCESGEDNDDLDSAKHIRENSSRIFTFIFYFIFGDSLVHIASSCMESGSDLDEVKGYLEGARYNLFKASNLSALDTEQDGSVDINSSLMQVCAMSITMENDDKDLLVFMKQNLSAQNAKEAFEYAAEVFEFVLIDLEDNANSEIVSIDKSLEALISTFSTFEQVKAPLKLLEIDARIRFALVSEQEIKESILIEFTSELDLVANNKGNEDSDRRQAYLLLSSIYEMLDNELEASRYYDLAKEARKDA